MCLILFAYKIHPHYPLILASNRDEYYSRPTQTAHFWPDQPHVLAGRDERHGGTWLGVTKQGRFATITNYRQGMEKHNPNRPSRGQLVSDYMTSDWTAEEFLNDVHEKATEYEGFNLLLGDPDKLFCYSNKESVIHPIQPGLYGLSNHLLETPWPKVLKGKEGFHQILNQNQTKFVPSLFHLLNDQTKAPDHELPDTGVGLEWERVLSSIFVSSPEYGTRSSTVLTFDKDHRVTFQEKSRDDKSEKWKLKEFELVLYSSTPSNT